MRQTSMTQPTRAGDVRPLGWSTLSGVLCRLGVCLLLGLGITPVRAAPLAYITNAGSNTVSVLDTSTHAVIATVPVGQSPQAVAVHPTGSRVYVANRYSQTLSIIDTATNTVSATVGVGSPVGIALHPDGTRLYVTNIDQSTVSVLDTATNVVMATVPVGTGPTTGPVGVAIHPDGTRLYVGNVGDRTLAVIDTAQNTQGDLFRAGTGPTGVVVHPDGTRVYVVNGCLRLCNSNTVAVFDTRHKQFIGIVQVGFDPDGIAAHPDGTRIYVANVGDNTVSVLDTASNTVTHTVPVGMGPTGVAVHPAGTRVYVANQASNTVSIIDTSTQQVVDTVGVGERPIAFGQFVSPFLPALTLQVDKPAFRQGEQLVLQATVAPGPQLTTADVYVALQLPDERPRLFLQADGSLTQEFRPIVAGWQVASFHGEIFRYTFNGSEPAGRYTWLGVFTEPGTQTMIGPMHSASFTFSP